MQPQFVITNFQVTSVLTKTCLKPLVYGLEDILKQKPVYGVIGVYIAIFEIEIRTSF